MVDLEQPTEIAEPKLRVFLSYSRKDSDFVSRLAAALTERGYLADFDQSTHHAETGSTGIAPTDDWWMRLQDMIAAADVMVLCVSPDSAASKVVDEEIAYARSLSKRVIAISCREIDFNSAPPRLSALNVNHWFLQPDFDIAINQLCVALDRDVIWLRASARYTVEAKAWDDDKRSPDRLLFGEEIAAAEAWSARRPATAPEVSELILAFLSASRAAHADRETKEKDSVRRTRRLQRWIGFAVTVAFGITLAGSWFVIEGQRSLGRAQSLMLARTAQQFLDDGDPLRALHLAGIASRASFLSPASAEADAMLSSSAQSLKLQVIMRGHERRISGAAFSKNENRILTWSDDGTARLWNAVTGVQVGPTLKHDDSVAGAAFSNNESRILSWGFDAARLWDTATGVQIGPSLEHYGGIVLGAVFSKDERRILSWGGDSARLWDAATGAQIGPALKHDGYVSGAVFSKDERRILSWSEDRNLDNPDMNKGDARLWDVASGMQIGPALEHRGLVVGAVFSEDESRILTWSQDKTARLWQVASGAQIGPPLQHEGYVEGALFSNDESRVLTWSGDPVLDKGDARLWDAATGAQIGPDLEHDGVVYGAVFAKGGGRILSWGGDSARLWDAATGVQIGPALQHDGLVLGAELSKDESRILTWSEDSTARLWNAATGAQIGYPLKHNSSVNGAKFSKDESRVLTWSGDFMFDDDPALDSPTLDKGDARLWDAATGAQIGPALKHDSYVEGAVFSKDESRVLSWSDDSTARLWNTDTGAQIGPVLQHEGTVYGAAFSKDESRILTYSVDSAVLWDAAKGVQIGRALKHDDVVFGAEFSRDDSQILTWSEDRTARLWHTATGAQIGPNLAHDERVVGAKFSTDESRILTWSGDSTARLWNAATGAQIGYLSQSVDGAEFSKDGSRVLTFGNRTVRLWNAVTGVQVGPTLKHDDSVAGAAFSNNESRILSWGSESVRFWDAATGVQIGPVLQHDGRVVGALFSKDDSRILTWSGNGTARLWDAATGAQIVSAFEHDNEVVGAVFSKTEGRILTWSADNTARLWDTRTGLQIGPALRHDGFGGIKGAAFSKDESRVLTWSQDKTARLWDVRWAMDASSAAELSAKACAAKLRGPISQASTKTTDNTTSLRKPILDERGTHPIRGPSRLDALDVEKAPILRGREGEDVCGWSPPWYDDILKGALGWAFR